MSQWDSIPKVVQKHTECLENISVSIEIQNSIHLHQYCRIPSWIQIIAKP